MSGFGRPLQEAALLTTVGSVAYLAARRGSPEDSDAVKARSWSATAVDLHTGTEKWSCPIRAYERDSTHALSSVVAGNRLVLCRTAGDDGLEVTALDTRTGKRAWQSTLPQSSPSGAPTRLHADEQRVYVSGDRVQAFRLTDGAAAWSFGGGHGAQSYGVPVLSGGTVYATHSAGVVALSADSGSLRWEAHIKGGADLRVPPVIDREYVFVMAEDGVRAISIRKRAEVWSSNLASPTLIGHTKTKRLIQAGRGQVFAVRYDVSF
jgi:outer membrane protein assembly factor BamB